jgi:hypothetical protein
MSCCGAEAAEGAHRSIFLLFVRCDESRHDALKSVFIPFFRAIRAQLPDDLRVAVTIAYAYGWRMHC